MTSGLVSTETKITKSGRELSPEQAAAVAMVEAAKEKGLSLTGPDGLLKLFTKNVLEAALNAEMTEHLGHAKHEADPERTSTNVRNGTRSKTVISDAVGEIEIEVPRDRERTFTPQIVKKRQRRLGDVNEVVLSLYAKGLTTGEISAHFADIYGASVSKDTVSRITETVVAEMEEWKHRPLDSVYAAIFIDAIVVKVRDGQVGQPAGVCGRGRHAGRPEGRAGALDGHWRRRGRQVLDERPCRPEEPRYPGYVLRDLRRSERIARSCWQCMAGRDSANVHNSPDQELVPFDGSAELG